MKNLSLAKLMNWKVKLISDDIFELREQQFESDGYPLLDPYSDSAQFVSIFMRFPQVVDSFHTEQKTGMTSAFYQGWCHDLCPTQENILDEILRMNGL